MADGITTKTRIVRNRETMHYHVKTWAGKVRTPNSDYFTSDREDAEATAKLMVTPLCQQLPLCAGQK